MIKTLSFSIVLFAILRSVSALHADGSSQTQLGGSIGYAVWQGETKNSPSLEIFLRHYFRKDIGIETSVMHFTRTRKEFDFRGERYEFSRTIVPVHVSFVYSPFRNSNQTLSFFLGGGILYTTNSLIPIGGEPEPAAHEIEFQMITGFSLDFKLRNNLTVIPRVVLAFHPEGFHYIAPHVGLGWSF